MDFCID